MKKPHFLFSSSTVSGSLIAVCLLAGCIRSSTTFTPADPDAHSSPSSPGSPQSPPSTPAQSPTNPDRVVHHDLISLPAVGAQSVTVSGVSSGAAMAIQLFVSSSSVYTGVASFAGAPYDCANGQKIFYTPALQAIKVCMQHPDLIDTSELVDNTFAYERGSDIDPLSSLRGRKAILFHGGKDSIVLPSAVDKIDAYLKSFEVATSVVKIPGMGHGLPSPNGTQDCGKSEAPYMGRCDDGTGQIIDGPGQALTGLYGPLAPRGSLREQSLHRFSQTKLVDTNSAVLAPEGFIYLPQACESRGSNCRLHVVLHGCLEGSEVVGDRFARLSGYNEWAESNNIIVLYPNTKSSLSMPLGTDLFDVTFLTPAQGLNPNGCWDWFGYTGSDFTTKKAPQIQAITTMVNAITR